MWLRLPTNLAFSGLGHQDILQHEELEIATKKHIQRVVGRADHRLTTSVEGGVKQYRVAGVLLERALGTLLREQDHAA